MTTEHVYGNSSTLALHAARNEKLCSACQAYRLTVLTEGQAAVEDRSILVEIEIPGTAGWRLQARAEALGKTLPAYLLGLALADTDQTVKRGQLPSVEKLERERLRRKIIDRIKLGGSNVQVGQAFRVSHEFVRRIRQDEKLPSARQIQIARYDRRIRELARARHNDAEIAALIGKSKSFVQERRSARQIPAGYRMKGNHDGKESARPTAR